MKFIGFIPCKTFDLQYRINNVMAIQAVEQPIFIVVQKSELTFEHSDKLTCYLQVMLHLMPMQDYRNC